MIKKKKKSEILFFILSNFLILLVPFFLSSCAPIKSEDITTSLLPNIWIFISHFIAFTVLLVVMSALVWKPTKKFLTKKQTLINKALDEAKKNIDEANNNLDLAKQNKIKAIEKANIMLKEAQDNASQIINNAKNNAKKEAIKIINKTNFDLESEKKQMRKEYQQNVIGTAFNIVKNIFLDEKNDKNKQKYLNNILDKIKKDYKKNEK